VCNYLSACCYRAEVYDKNLLSDAPSTYKYVDPVGKEWNKETEAYSLQVSTEDCTGCTLCVEYCPITSKTDATHKAINMMDKTDLQEAEKIKLGLFSCRFLK
jgi:pyruvate-ferredoxin/flavodoxin oxidoreductase